MIIKMDQQEKIFVVLIAKGVSDAAQRSRQSNAMTILSSMNVPFVLVDGMDPDPAQRKRCVFFFSIIGGIYFIFGFYVVAVN